MRRSRPASQPEVLPVSKRRKARGLQPPENEEDRIMPQFPQPPPEQLPNGNGFHSHEEDKVEVEHPTPNTHMGNGRADDKSDPGGADDAFSAEEDDDMDEEVRPEELERVKKDLSKKGFAYSGILESVQLDRFMSHHCFEYKFGRNINIINGPNGSGKSAIVAALQIGLGARASATERASKLEEHIMHGKDSAVITIRIHNVRPEEGAKDEDFTFKYERYGPKIIIERRLVKKGGSNFIIKDSRGKKPELDKGETPRSEVRDLVDHFGLMVDNPVAILTQTKSKEFLAKCRPAQHYKLYKEATLLGPLEQTLNQTLKESASLHKEVKRKEFDLPRVLKDLQKLENAYNEAEAMRNIDEQVSYAELVLFWTNHADAQKTLDRYETLYTSEFEPERANAEEEYDAAKLKVQAVDDQMRQLNIEYEAKSDERKQYVDAAKLAEKNVKDEEYAINRHRSAVIEAESDIADLKNRIKNEEETLKKKRLEHLESQKQKDDMERQMTETEQSVSNLEQEMNAAREKDTKLAEKLYADRDQLPRISADLAHTERNFDNKRSLLMRLQNLEHRDMTLARFGEGFINLQSRIASEVQRGAFHLPPVGPIGSFIKVRDQNWAQSIEACIGRGTLSSYIVHDGHDAKRLQDILRNVNASPSIIVRKLDRARYNIRQNDKPNVVAPGRTRHVLLDMLTFDHDAVHNTLVDQSNIERIVLVGSMADGQVEPVADLAWDRNYSNVYQVWNQYGEHAYTRNGSNTFRRAPPRFRGRPSLLNEDKTVFLNNLRKEIDELDQQRRTCVDRKRELERAVAESKREMDEARAATHAKQMELQRAKIKRSRIQDLLGQATSAFDAEPYEKEIASLNAGIQEKEKKKSASENWAKEGQSKMEALKADAKEAKKKMRVLDAETEEKTHELSKKDQELTQVQKVMRRKKARFEEAQTKCRRGKYEIEKKKEEVRNAMKDAEDCGPRPPDLDPVKKPPAEALKKLQKLKSRQQAEQERRDGKTVQEIEREYRVAKQKYDEQESMLERIRSYAEAISSGVEYRINHKKQLEKVLRKHVRNNFANFLGVRGHAGNLRFKRSEKSGDFELVITTRLSSHKSKDGKSFVTEDLRSLSGGERSFTTLAFMLALAEVCNNPIRVMDEIDVFQDEANRRASFKTLIDYCSSYLTDKQFIIITPHALPDIQPSDYVRIQKLSAPRPDDGNQQTMDQYLRS